MQKPILRRPLQALVPANTIPRCLGAITSGMHPSFGRCVACHDRARYGERHTAPVRRDAMPHDPRCVFCQIVAEPGKCVLLAADPEAMAFMDIHPANPGHCLVVPKGHWPTVFDIPPDGFAAVGRLVVRIAAGVQRALAASADLIKCDHSR